MRKLLLVASLTTLCTFAQKPPKPGLYALFHTELGDIRAFLYEKDTPNTVLTFVGLAQGTQQWLDPDHKQVRKPYYDNTTFFRVVPGMAIQAGSPTGKGDYNCGFLIRDEILPGLQFRTGTLAMANAGPDTGSCQFFFTEGPTSSWNGKYTIFGQAVDGLDVVTKLIKTPAHGEEPINPPKLISVTIERVGPPPVIKKKK